MKQYINQVSEVWGLGSITVKNLSSKGQRAVHIIQTDGGNYILKFFTPKIKENLIIKYTESLRYLNTKNPKLAPEIIETLNGNLYSKINGQFTYLMEKIAGRQLQENIEDEYRLGQASARLHQFSDYNIPSCLDIDSIISDMKTRFAEYQFKSEYNKIIDSLPDFNKFKQTFIHTDIGPHNAMIAGSNQVIFVDWDDAGQGSPYLDIGYPLITQFVQMNKRTKEIKFKQNVAKAFYQGYNSILPIKKEEQELIYYGAVFMQLMYMPCFGNDAVKDMWAILKFSIDNKDSLLSTIPQN